MPVSLPGCKPLLGGRKESPGGMILGHFRAKSCPAEVLERRGDAGGEGVGATGASFAPLALQIFLDRRRLVATVRLRQGDVIVIVLEAVRGCCARGEKKKIHPKNGGKWGFYTNWESQPLTIRSILRKT